MVKCSKSGRGHYIHVSTICTPWVWYKTMMFQSGAKMARSCTWRNFLSQKRSKLCHDPSSISFDRPFYICIWKITKLKLTTSWSHSGFQRSIGTIMSFCCKYLKSEMIRCVGSFTSCDLARSKRLTTSKDSQSILLISLGAKSAI